MTAVVVDGRAEAQRLVEATAARVQAMGLAPPPTLAIVVSDAPGASRNLGIKRHLASVAGVRLQVVVVPAAAETAEIVSRVAALGAAADVDGVFLQFPFPSAVDVDALAAAIPADRDVDGSGPAAAFPPAAVAAALATLAEAGVLRAGRRAVLVGPADGPDDRGPVPGFLGALSRRLVAAGLVVARVDVGHPSWEATARGADVVVTAIGGRGHVTAASTRPGAVVVDGGIARVDGRVVGDIDLSSVAATAALVVPMPGGLGPLTVAALLDHVVTAAERRAAPSP